MVMMEISDFRGIALAIAEVDCELEILEAEAELASMPPHNEDRAFEERRLKRETLKLEQIRQLQRDHWHTLAT